jgi:hypothetical protein
MLCGLLLVGATEFCFSQAQATGAGAAAKSGSSGQKLSGKQKSELYTEGTITDSQGNVWRIKTLPGTSKIKKIAKAGWVNAGHIIKDSLKQSKKFFSLLGKKTYYTKNLKGIVVDGVHGIKTSAKAMKSTLKFTKSAFTDDFYKGIRNDWRKTCRKNSVAIKDGSIGYQFQVVKNTMGTGFKTVGRVIYTPLKASAGVIGIAGSATGIASSAAYSAVAPEVYYVGTPVVAAIIPEVGATAALGDILARGMIAPSAMYFWNGSAWVVSKSGKVPNHTTYWITLQRSAADVPHTVAVDKDAFTAIVQAAVLQHLTDAQIAEIEKQVDALTKELDEIRNQTMALNDQRRNKSRDISQKRTDLANSSAMQEWMRLTREGFNPNATMQVTDDVKALNLDDTALSQLVRNTAKAQNSELTDEQVTEIVKNIHMKVQMLSK